MNYREFFVNNLSESVKNFKKPVEIEFGSTKFELMMTWMNSLHSKIVMISPQLTNSTIQQKNNTLKTKQPNITKWWGYSSHLISNELKHEPKVKKGLITTLVNNILSRFAYIDVCIIPYAPNIQDVMNVVEKKLKSRYVFLDTKTDRFYSNLSFLLLVRRGLLLIDLLGYIGEKAFVDIGNHFNKKVIFKDIIIKVNSLPNSMMNEKVLKDFILFLLDYINTDNDIKVSEEELVKKLFCDFKPLHILFDNKDKELSKQDNEEIKKNHFSNLTNLDGDEDYDDKLNDIIIKTPETHKTPKSKKYEDDDDSDDEDNEKDKLVDEPDNSDDENNVEFYENKVNFVEYYKGANYLSNEYNEPLDTYINEYNNIITDLVYDSEKLEDAIGYYTEDSSYINQCLGTKYVEKILLKDSRINFYDTSFKPKKGLKLNISRKEFEYILKLSYIIEEIYPEISQLIKLTFNKKLQFEHNLVLFRGIPIKNSGLYRSDIWLRKDYFLDDKTNLADDDTGLFQEEMYLQVKKNKSKTLSDFYKIDKENEYHSSETFFSTSLSFDIASDFGSTAKAGHLIIINAINSPSIMFGDLSAVASELEVLLPPNAKLKLDRVEYLSDVNFKKISISFNKPPSKYSLCFFLTYDTGFKDTSKELLDELKKRKLFWNNINKFMKISNVDDYK